MITVKTTHAGGVQPSISPDLTDTRSSTYYSVSEYGALLNALDHMPAGLAIYDRDLRMTYCNSILKRMLDYPDELFSSGFPTMERIFRFNAERGEYGDGNVENFVASKLALAQKREAHNYERRRPNGAVLEVRGVPLEDGGFATIYVDESLQIVIANTPTSVHLGDIDSLTGLPSDKSVERHIAECQRALKPGEKACIMTIDLWHFKQVNDRYGRAVGDYVLREVGIRLSDVKNGSDFLGRTGGDRFTIVHPIVVRLSDPAKLAGRLVQKIRQPIVCGRDTIEVSVAVGFTLITQNDRDIREILLRSKESVIRERHERLIA